MVAIRDVRSLSAMVGYSFVVCYLDTTLVLPYTEYLGEWMIVVFTPDKSEWTDAASAGHLEEVY